AAGPAAVPRSSNIGISTQFRLSDDRTLDEGVGLTDDDTVRRSGRGIINNQLSISHHVGNRFEYDISTRGNSVRIRKRWHHMSSSAAKIYSRTCARGSFCSVTSRRTAIANPLAGLINALTLGPSRNRAQCHNEQ